MSKAEALPDTPISVADLVAYAAGAVVSRTLMKGPAGTVTAFAFDAGEGLSEHTAPYDALILGVDGSARITVGAVRHALTAGEIIRLPATVPHAIEATSPFKMLLLMIRSPAIGQ